MTIALPASWLESLLDQAPEGALLFQLRTSDGACMCVAHPEWRAELDGLEGASCLLSLGAVARLGGASSRVVAVEVTLVNATRHLQPLLPLRCAARLRLQWEVISQYAQALELPDEEAMALQHALAAAVERHYPVLQLHDLLVFEPGAASSAMGATPMELRVTSLHTTSPVTGGIEQATEGEPVLLFRSGGLDVSVEVAPPAAWLSPDELHQGLSVAPPPARQPMLPPLWPPVLRGNSEAEERERGAVWGPAQMAVDAPHAADDSARLTKEAMRTKRVEALERHDARGK